MGGSNTKLPALVLNICSRLVTRPLLNFLMVEASEVKVLIAVQEHHTDAHHFRWRQGSASEEAQHRLYALALFQAIEYEESLCVQCVALYLQIAFEAHATDQLNPFLGFFSVQII